MKENYESKTISSSRWSVLSQLAQVINPITLIVLAAFLEPEDMGIFAISMIIIAFAQLIWDPGLNKALIQLENDLEKSLNTVFWINSMMAVIVYVSLFVFSGMIADFYSDSRIQAVIQIHGLLIILNSFYTVNLTLFQRNLEFKPIFWAQNAGSIVPNLIALPLSIIGFRYWSLIVGSIMGGLIQLFILLKIGRWRPKWNFDFQILKKLFTFGIWVTIEFVIGWFFSFFDEIIIGTFLGLSVLGLYHTGKNLVNMFFSAFFGSLVPVMFSYFSRIQKNLSKLTNALLTAIKFHSMFALSAGLMLFLFSGYFTNFIFQSRWVGIDIVISILGLSYGIAYFMSPNASAYRAIGRADYQVKLLVLLLLYSVPMYFLSIHFGLNAFLWVQCSVHLVAIPIHLYLLGISFDLRVAVLFKELKFVLLSLIGLILTVLTITNQNLVDDIFLKSILSVSVGTFIFLLLLLPDRKFINKIVGMVYYNKESHS